MKKSLLSVAALALCASATAAPSVVHENFDNILHLPGWLMVNRSIPPGINWFQGNSGIFSAYNGAANSYIAVNYLSSQNGAGTVDQWLITPEVQLTGNSLLSFFRRGGSDPGFEDKLELRFSPGASGDPNDFSFLLASFGFPTPGWQQYSQALAQTGTGRFAFHYSGDANMLNYIGIDNFDLAIGATQVPEPPVLALFGLGLAALLWRARRRALPALALLMLAGSAMAKDGQAQGMIMVRDAETGAMRSATSAELAELRKQKMGMEALHPHSAHNASPVKPTPTLRQDGSLQLKLGAIGMSYYKLERDADGNLKAQCATADAKQQEVNHEHQ